MIFSCFPWNASCDTFRTATVVMTLAPMIYATFRSGGGWKMRVRKSMVRGRERVEDGERRLDMDGLERLDNGKERKSMVL